MSTITVTPKGDSDFYATLTRPPYPAENFNADKNGMTDVVSALARRANYDSLSNFQPLIIARQTEGVVLASNTWTPIPFDTVEFDANNWLNGTNGTITVPVTVQPPQPYIYINLKLAWLSELNGSYVDLRILLDGSTLGKNRFYSDLSVDTLNRGEFISRYIPFYPGAFIQLEAFSDAPVSEFLGLDDTDEDNHLELYY